MSSVAASRASVGFTARRSRGTSNDADWLAWWLAIVAALIYRYGDRHDVSLRLLPDGLVALDLSDDPTFAEVHRRVELALAGRAAPGTVRIVVQSSDGAPLLRRLGGERCDVDPAAAVVVALSVADETLHGGVEYGPRCIDHGMAARLAAHLTNIATHVAASPSLPLSQIDMLGDAERERLLAMMTGPSVGYPDVPAHELFERTAAARPDAVAVIESEATVTFGELNRRANRLAHCLRSAGVAAEVRVGLCAERSTSAVVGVFGILKAGGVYVPLDPTYPADRLRAMCEAADLGVIAGTGRALALLPPTDALRVDIDEVVRDRALREDGNPSAGVGLDHAAYIVHTSGSTGAPKALVLTHRSIVNMFNRVPFRRDDPTEMSPLNSPLSVGFTTARLFLPLLCGLPLVIIPDGEERELTRLVLAWEEAGVTNVAMVTPVLRQLLALGPRFTSRLRRVRTFVVGGDVMGPELLAGFAAAWPDATLIHGYTASEVGGPAIIQEGRVTAGADSVAIGEPFPNTSLMVVDRWLNLLPIGVAGEICISARHLARGYLNQPEKTAERWVRNPFVSDGTPLYRTGDVGRVLPDGRLEVLGRIDDQVKIRGFRVDVREIEAVLAEHHGVQMVAVVARDHDEGRRLLAYVVSADGAVTASALRAFLTNRLPQYMVPSLFVFVDALPRTASGKIDRKALPAPGAGRPEIDVVFEPPRNRIERCLAQIWTTLLGVDGIGVHDHLLEVGGDSLFVTNLVLAIEEEFGVQTHEASVFERPTIAALAEWLQEAAAHTSRRALQESHTGVQAAPSDVGS